MSLVKLRIHRTLQLQRKLLLLTRLGKRYFGKKSTINFTWRAPLEKAVPFYLQYCCYNKAVGRALSGLWIHFTRHGKIQMKSTDKYKYFLQS